jgi:hypothetical protein
MRVIFLDVDGVLNSQQFFKQNNDPVPATSNSMKFGVGQLDTKALTLLDILIDATGAKIVVSSSWRHIWPFHEIAEMFGDVGFKNQHAIIDQTGNSKSGFRGEEVKNWLSLDRERQEVGGEQTTAYVIIDDDSDFDTSQHEFFVQTDSDVGLTQEDIVKAAGILGGEQAVSAVRTLLSRA